MAIQYTKKLLVQRIKQHIADGYPSEDFSSSENEILLYVDQALASTIVGQTYSGAKVEGSLVVPDAYYTTYKLPSLAQDNVTSYWYTTLPQPPLSLPLGYSIDNVYFANPVNGRGMNVFLIKAKRVAYRENMPMPFGVRAWVEGNTLYLMASDGTSLLNQDLYARMASSRTASVDDVMNVPDDAIATIFDNVVQKLIQRMQLQKDVVKDDLPSGATNISK
jgi:hypothetical protein